MHPKAIVHQAIHQPVPVVGGLHGDGLELRVIRLERLTDRRQFVGQPLLEDWLAGVIDHRAERIVGMQVQTRV